MKRLKRLVFLGVIVLAVPAPPRFARAECKPPATWLNAEHTTVTLLLATLHESSNSLMPAAATEGAVSAETPVSSEIRVLRWRPPEHGCDWNQLTAQFEQHARFPWVLLGERPGTVAEARDADSSGDAARASVSLRFGPDGPADLDVRVETRTVRGVLFTRSAPVHVPAGAQGIRAARALGEAVASYLAYRDRRYSWAARQRFKQRAMELVTAWDDTDAEGSIARALGLQIHGLLLMDDVCRRLDAILMLRRAVALVPYSSDARRLLAVAELRTAYEPELACLERQLLAALTIDPSRPNTLDALGVFYDLTSHAPPAAGDHTRRQEYASQGLRLVPEAHLPEAPHAIELAGAIGVGSEATPGLRFELTPFGRDRSGLGFRLGVSLPGSRTVQVSPGSALWRRYSTTAELRGRWWWGGQPRIGSLAIGFLEMHAGPVLTVTSVSGQGFDRPGRSLLAEWGAVAGARFGFRLRPRFLAVWADASGYVWPMERTPQALLPTAPALVDGDPLPRTDWSVVAGLSLFIWS
jgi:hypothetical protein